ncbi:MAG: hypothetical protein EZS28_028965 [Streblomastix strix]|uniref:Cyclin N-terminal domain-containing protein n=1 Tax=Streblomastix strix TaxID=222440 RepID=A0A5J4UYD5_9EUKA|nr:MAG: hypothetical protein EZS28_028965 [Streblomastix strix]
MQSYLPQFQDASSEIEKSEIADDTISQTQKNEINDNTFLSNKQQLTKKKQNVCIQHLAQKLFEILIDAVPNASEVVSTASIILFFKYMKLNVNISISESLETVLLLQRFISKQTEKGIQVLSSRNLGTMLVVLAIVAMKNCRDAHIYKNSHFAKEFDIPLTVLNESEAAFMKIVDYSLFIDESEYSNLQNDIFKD